MHDITHLMYAAIYEKPGVVRGWRELDQMDTNLRMLEIPSCALQWRKQNDWQLLGESSLSIYTSEANLAERIRTGSSARA